VNVNASIASIIIVIFENTFFIFFVFLLVYSGAKVSILCTNHKFFPEKAIGITIIGGEKSLLGQRLWGKGYRL
jgi:hypothetical protein